MRRFYQESWQGIPFTAFSCLSFFRLAGPKFYSIFYEELFNRYKDWNDLPKTWRMNKTLDAEWLSRRLKKISSQNPVKKVLSIGSGVGFMEKTLLSLNPDIELYVNEPSTVGMRWLRKHVPSKNIFIGFAPACLPADIKWNLIYLSAVDYGIPARELETLLDALRSQLAPGGEIICISASLLDETSLAGGMVNVMKNIIRGCLHYLGVRRQQFWGWRRTKKEYREMFTKAGFINVTDGILDDGFESYWISGK